MAKYKFALSFLVLLLGEYVESDLFYDILSKVDPCEAFCDKKYPAISHSNKKHGSCCRKGCELFNLVKLSEDMETIDMNATKTACQASCLEAYSHTRERCACNLGCASQAKQKQADAVVSQISWSVYIEDGNSVMVIQPDLEPDDVLTDPGLRRQLERAWAGVDGNFAGRGLEDRLPQTHVLTLPVPENKMERRMGGDWLECASLRTGLPRAVLGCAVLVPILLVLWLFLAPSRHMSLQDVEALNNLKDPFDPPHHYKDSLDPLCHPNKI